MLFLKEKGMFLQILQKVAEALEIMRFKLLHWKWLLFDWTQ